MSLATKFPYTEKYKREFSFAMFNKVNYYYIYEFHTLSESHIIFKPSQKPKPQYRNAIQWIRALEVVYIIFYYYYYFIVFKVGFFKPELYKKNEKEGNYSN